MIYLMDTTPAQPVLPEHSLDVLQEAMDEFQKYRKEWVMRNPWKSIPWGGGDSMNISAPA